jgi:hypothetical protein
MVYRDSPPCTASLGRVTLRCRSKQKRSSATVREGTPMSSSFFNVDLDVLASFVSTLHESDAHMSSALEAMSSGAAGQIGTDELNGAADDFQSTWQYGLKQLGKTIAETTEGVSKAHDAYQSCEDQLGGVLGRLNGVMGNVDSAVDASTPAGGR